MSGLVGFLIASTIFAAIGTAVRGLLRPISWALLAIALGLLISNRLTATAGSDTEEITNQTTPTLTPAASSNRPVAVEGWQAVARDLEPVYSDTLVDAQNAAAASGGNGNSTDSSAANDGTVSPGSTNSSARQNSSAPAFEQFPSPIPGFW